MRFDRHVRFDGFIKTPVYSIKKLAEVIHRDAAIETNIGKSCILSDILLCNLAELVHDVSNEAIFTWGHVGQLGKFLETTRVAAVLHEETMSAQPGRIGHHGLGVLGTIPLGPFGDCLPRWNAFRGGVGVVEPLNDGFGSDAPFSSDTEEVVFEVVDQGPHGR